MYDIYYAHHRWKYGTEIEKYELDLIKKYFPNARICNPATDINLPDWIKRESSEEDLESRIMTECLRKVADSDILIFSSVNGCSGIGVYTEVTKAIELGKIVFYIYHGELNSNFDIVKRHPNDRTDRIYANVYMC